MNTKRGRPSFLREPNYYRLLYRIAATHVNEALKPEKDRTTKATPSELTKRGATVAAELAEHVRETLEEYRRRQELPWLRRVWRGEGLSDRDERIQWLLANTVLPCTNILIAATLLGKKRWEEADRLIEPIRKAAAEGTGTYRVYYNLACFMADRSRVTPLPLALDRERLLEEAFRYLTQGLSRARSGRQSQLATWAEGDPSLEPLRADKKLAPKFRALLDRYKPAETAEKAPRKRRAGPKRSRAR